MIASVFHWPLEIWTAVCHFKLSLLLTKRRCSCTLAPPSPPLPISYLRCHVTSCEVKNPCPRQDWSRPLKPKSQKPLLERKLARRVLLSINAEYCIKKPFYPSTTQNYIWKSIMIFCEETFSKECIVLLGLQCYVLVSFHTDFITLCPSQGPVIISWGKWSKDFSCVTMSFTWSPPSFIGS